MYPEELYYDISRDTFGALVSVQIVLIEEAVNPTIFLNVYMRQG